MGIGARLELKSVYRLHYRTAVRIWQGFLTKLSVSHYFLVHMAEGGKESRCRRTLNVMSVVEEAGECYSYVFWV